MFAETRIARFPCYCKGLLFVDLGTAINIVGSAVNLTPMRVGIVEINESDSILLGRYANSFIRGSFCSYLESTSEEGVITLVQLENSNYRGE
jgi:hypothetical protein